MTQLDESRRDVATPAASSDGHERLLATPLSALARRPPVCVGPATTIRDAARLMREHGVSSLMLLEDERLVGIVTDRDLRNRALAAGIDSAQPVRVIASAEPLTVALQASAFDAMLLMARHDIHHLPVLDGAKVVGMLTATDIARQQASSAVVLAGEIHEQDGLDGLVRASGHIRALQRGLAAADASAYATGHVITAITDALTTRLVALAQSRSGQSPVPFVWVAAGSQARCEQTAKSDQDNCMILGDGFDPAAHGAYFEVLTREVCGGLDACGYVFCPGQIMAMTETWRQPQTRWSDYFARWIDQPEPEALLNMSVFFDLRAVAGDATLLDAVRSQALQRTCGNSLFLSHMVRNAVSRQPPLGLFGKLRTERSEPGRDTIDLKMHGIVPVVDLARVYALAGGHAEVNTHDRLEVAAQSREVSEQGARDLRDVLEFLSALRIVHQVRRMDAGQPVDNLLSPDELSGFERTQLKDAFRVVQSMQEVLARRYHVSRL